MVGETKTYKFPDIYDDTAGTVNIKLTSNGGNLPNCISISWPTLTINPTIKEEAGTYKIQVTITDKDNAKSTSSMTVTIKNPNAV